MQTAPAVERSLPEPGNWKDQLQANITAGFLVFLIALPLCLAIANASYFPPVAGVLTAIIGGLVAPWLSNSQLTIKGPAAGLIVIVAGCATSFGWVLNDPAAQFAAYRCVLAVGVLAGVIQILMAVLRLGIISELFPTSVVHGMLASIGIIIIAKQSHLMLGATPAGKEPLHLLAEIPHSLLHGLNPEIAVIGLACLAILAFWPLLKIPYLKQIPGPVLVVLFSIPLGLWFQLNTSDAQPHHYLISGHDYTVSEKFLVSVPGSMLSGITTPDFSRVLTWNGAWWITLFSLIGSLESILSARAVDVIDPWKRKTDFNKDLLAVGVANTLAAVVGGLPMISEIVRSRANIDNGARGKYSNMFHGLFLLVCLLAIPGVIHLIPVAALAAMLVFTGFRLASPKEFLHMYHLGLDQLIVFISTVIGVLATDLLLGILLGTGVKLALHVLRGVSPLALVRNKFISEEADGSTVILRARDAVVFSTWIPLRRRLIAIDPSCSVVVDLSTARLVDHTVMEKLYEMQADWSSGGRSLRITGLENHSAASSHPLACHRIPTSANSIPTTA